MITFALPDSIDAILTTDNSLVIFIVGRCLRYKSLLGWFLLLNLPRYAAAILAS